MHCCVIMYLSTITNGLWRPDDLTLLMTRLYFTSSTICRPCELHFHLSKGQETKAQAITSPRF